ncbi:Clp protease ClpP [Pseudalkalibacillus caeni]|uniref:ATP-dependent Clp protease proteolytic subunit n=1 Tax=Exobacillus caeni TaxID=2574798 RepID=A0A5R9F656_9BACL|nr:Clp protease ClpP [Pseudalkalibacillus caeni]
MRRFKNEKYNKLATVENVFKAEKSDDDSHKITIYGDIGESWWGESTSAKDIEDVLNKITSGTINLHLNSPGGDVFDGIAIYNQLKNHASKVIVHVDGLAASAASIIAMAADELIMNTGSMMMIHEASTFAWGNKADFQKALNALEGIDKSIVDIYMTRFQGERSEIETMLQGETWFTSDEAVDVGLADRVNQTVEEDDDDDVDPEEFKNSVLNRIRANKGQQPKQPDSTQQSNTILNRFKRQAN